MEFLFGFMAGAVISIALAWWWIRKSLYALMSKYDAGGAPK
jgi:hypothetical protein